LNTRQGVRSKLTSRLIEHFDRVWIENKKKEIISYSGEKEEDQQIDYLSQILLGSNKNINQHKRKDLERNLKSEIWNDKNVAIIGEKIFEKYLSQSLDNKTSNCSIQYKSILMDSGKSSCDIDIIAQNFSASELKKLGQKELHYQYPDRKYKAMIGGFLSLLLTLSGDENVKHNIFWKFASEENEYRIKVGTPIMLIGEFTFQRGRMKANKIDFFGKNLYSLIENVENSIWNWRYILYIMGGILGIFAIKKLVMIRYESVKKELLKEQEKMEEALAKQSETVEENYKCIICYTYLRNIIFEPCKHLVCCLFCVKSMKEANARVASKCVMCKTPISKFVQIAYNSN
jgi:hypothetical protein